MIPCTDEENLTLSLLPPADSFEAAEVVAATADPVAVAVIDEDMMSLGGRRPVVTSNLDRNREQVKQVSYRIQGGLGKQRSRRACH